MNAVSTIISPQIPRRTSGLLEKCGEPPMTSVLNSWLSGGSSFTAAVEQSQLRLFFFTLQRRE